MLFVFSFLYLKKSTIFIKENDKLMIEIKDNEFKYNSLPINAIITNNTMIPGIYGKKINLDETYKRMKKIDYFNESLLVFDLVEPNKSIKDIYDKIIISGNYSKKNISIILSTNEENIITYFDKILKANNIYADILINKNINITNTNFKNIISTNYQDYIGYCLSYNLIIPSSCIKNNKFTILGNLINNYYLTKTKEIVKNGIILVYQFNKNNYQELNIIIKYLKNNNYNIVPISELILEK